MSTDTPSLAQVIKNGIDAALAELNTAMPGEIASYDDVTGLASVQPCLQRKYAADGKVVDLPLVTNVPVCNPRGGGAIIKFPFLKGDPVVLICSQRSLDRWLVTGGKVDPQDPRKHALSDAFAIPGGYPKSKPQSLATVTLEFTKTGLKVSNKTGELITALYNILTTATAGGFPLVVSPDDLAILTSFKT
jgi:hypothetical protein